MKILYIMHSGNLIYGAARSLGSLLRNQNEHFDLMCSNYLYDAYGEMEIRRFAGNNLDNLYHFHLPNEIKMLRMSTEYTFIARVLDTLREAKQNMRYHICKSEIYKVIENGHYDAIHINSIVLYQLIRKNEKYVIHVREICSEYGMHSFSRKLRLAKGAICIDNAAHEYLPIEPQKVLILNNPFDMTSVNNIDKTAIRRQYGINEDPSITIFAVLGKISENKGIDFLIKAFMTMKNPATCLIIAGNGEEKFCSYCRTMAEDDRRIIFTGEISEPENVYAIADYIVRADAFFATGRTVYEGLYAGCGVIMQGEIGDLKNVNEYEKFGDKIKFYKPRDSKSCIELLEAAASEKHERTDAVTNIHEYVSEFNNWVEGIIND